jgi:hypothetical protein
MALHHTARGRAVEVEREKRREKVSDARFSIFANVWQNGPVFAKHWQIQKVGRAVPGEPFAKHWQNHAKFAKHWHSASAEASARSLPRIRGSRLEIREHPSSKGLGLPLISWQNAFARGGGTFYPSAPFPCSPFPAS